MLRRMGRLRDLRCVLTDNPACHRHKFGVLVLKPHDLHAEWKVVDHGMGRLRVGAPIAEDASLNQGVPPWDARTGRVRCGPE